MAMLSGARSLYAMAQWAQAALAGRRGEEQAIAIDGKALRGIHGEEVPGVLGPDRYLSDLEARWNQLAQAP